MTGELTLEELVTAAVAVEKACCCCGSSSHLESSQSSNSCNDIPLKSSSTELFGELSRAMTELSHRATDGS